MGYKFNPLIFSGFDQVGSSGGGGGVTNVTASLPLSSSGGATPNISITLADSVTDGYLSATDWNTFNNKVSGPVSSTDNAIARYDGTTGQLIKDSLASIDDSGVLTTANFSGSSTGTNTGDVTLTTIGSTPNNAGLSLSGQQLRLQPASATFGGAVTTGTQSFAGNKTFTGAIITTVTNPALAGTIRLGNTQRIAWQNAANTQNFSLQLDATDTFSFNAGIRSPIINVLDNVGASFSTLITSPVLAADLTLILPPDMGSPNYFLKTDSLGNTSWAPVVTTPGGADTQVQFNDAGTLNGVSSFTFDKTLRALVVGQTNIASNTNSSAFGQSTEASGIASHAEGNQTLASGDHSHAEGTVCSAQGDNSHAEGNSTTADANAAHSEGFQTIAQSANSHAEGRETLANGLQAHSEGRETTASGVNSHAAGHGTSAQSDNQTVVGQYNIPVGTPASPASTDEIFTVGNGANSGAKNTALAVLRDGSLSINGSLGAVGDVVTSQGPGVPPIYAPVSAQVKVATIKEIQTSGTDAGGFTAGAWQTRILNTLNDPSSIITSLISNQFILPAGTYEILCNAPAFLVSSHKAKLFNITDTADVIIGGSAYTPALTGSQTDSMILGIFTIAAPKTFEIQHQCQATHGGNGFGTSSSFSVDEVYTQVRISKIG